MELMARYREGMSMSMQGGGSVAVEKHKKRHKLLARERIDQLIDKNTPFLELSPMAAYDTYIHWKLSAKTDELVLREPMEPEQGRAVLTMDLNGTPDELDLKFSRLFSYGNRLLGTGIPFEVLTLTGNGIETWIIHEKWQLNKCTDALLCTPFAKEGSLRDRTPVLR